MCKRIMPHFQKAATQLRGHFVSEASWAIRAGWLSVFVEKNAGGKVGGQVLKWEGTTFLSGQFLKTKPCFGSETVLHKDGVLIP
jgi:hypothetical protein